jgi:hypothetical protein
MKIMKIIEKKINKAKAMAAERSGENNENGAKRETGEAAKMAYGV